MPGSTGTSAARLIPRCGPSFARSFPRILLSGVAVTALLGLGRPAGAQTVPVGVGNSPYTQGMDVTTTNYDEHGIEITGPNVMAAIATGVTVSTSGNDAYGVYATGGSNALTNNGTVATSGDGAFGVFARDGSNTLTNSGTILTAGIGAYGVYATGDSNTLTNSGTVSTWTYGVIAVGDFNTLTNSGTISTSGDGHGAYGVRACGNSNTLTNSGTISTSGDGAFGVAVENGSNALTNSGTVTASGSDSYAIYFEDSGNSLTLLTGSRLSGAAGEIYLGSGTAVTIDIDSGPSFVWSYSGDSGAALTSFTNTGSIPVADTGSSFVGVTPSDIAQSSQTTAHHNLAIAGMLDRVSQQQIRPVRVASLAEVQLPAPPEWTAWSMAYGERVNGRDSADASYSTTLRGLAAGIDRHVAGSDLTVGGFVGGDLSRTHLDGSTHRVRGRNVYAGIRAGEDTGEGLFWNAAGFAGHGGIRSAREVSGGTMTARADTDALFGGTSGTVGLHLTVAEHLGATLRGRATYGVQHTDGYDEDISGAKLTVDDRWAQNVSGRLEVSLDRFAADGGWQLSPRFGVESWRTVGDRSTAISFGGLPYTVSDDRTDGTGVVFGLDASLDLDAGVTVSAMTEARLEENDTTTIRGFVQIEAPF